MTFLFSPETIEDAFSSFASIIGKGEEQRERMVKRKHLINQLFKKNYVWFARKPITHIMHPRLNLLKLLKLIFYAVLVQNCFANQFLQELAAQKIKKGTVVYQKVLFDNNIYPIK